MGRRGRTLAAALHKHGKRVLLVDFDPQANLTDYLGCEHSNAVTMNDLMTAAVQNQPIVVKGAIQTNAEGIDYIPSSITLSGTELYIVNTFCREQVLKRVLQPIIEENSYDYIVIDCLPSLGILLVNALTVANSVVVPVQAQKFALDGLHVFFKLFKWYKVI